MKYRALVSFCGKISMYKNEEREIQDPALVADLLKAKYIEPLEEKKKKSPSKKGR